MTTTLLDKIDGPDDLKGLDDEQLQQVAQEVRELIIDTIGEIGGHFGANLGACEIAVAIHSLLDSPRDKVLWDVGHQAYPHKVLTGRRDQLAHHPQVRRPRAVLLDPRVRARHHGRGPRLHLGLLRGRASRRRCARGVGEDGKVVAVIGDGALTGGVAFEALHNAGGMDLPIVIVLNDNGMSIAPNVGALSRYFNRIRLNPKLHQRARGRGDRAHQAARRHRRAHRAPRARSLKESLKAYWAPGPVLRGARPGLRRRDRRPRRGRAARGASARRSRPTGRWSSTARR